MPANINNIVLGIRGKRKSHELMQTGEKGEIRKKRQSKVAGYVIMQSIGYQTFNFRGRGSMFSPRQEESFFSTRHKII